MMQKQSNKLFNESDFALLYPDCNIFKIRSVAQSKNSVFFIVCSEKDDNYEYKLEFHKSTHPNSKLRGFIKYLIGYELPPNDYVNLPIEVLIGRTFDWSTLEKLGPIITTL